MKPQLTDIRSRIDTIDSQLCELIRQRFDIMEEVAEAKRQVGKPVYDAAREQEVLKRAMLQVGPQYETEIHRIFSTMMEASKARQRTILGKKSEETEPIQKMASEEKIQPHCPNLVCQEGKEATSEIASSKMAVAVVGLGLIGGSLFKAAMQAGYDVVGIDKGERVKLADRTLVILALPAEVLEDWLTQFGTRLQPGTIVVDTCGVKVQVCQRARRALPRECIFVGGHPMAGKEQSGFAYSEATLFQEASMILTPYPDTPAPIISMLVDFFGKLGFAHVEVTTPEHHDKMIAYTSQLSHVIAASYVQSAPDKQVAPYAAGSYANMTRIASMNANVWEQLFSSNREYLLEELDVFMGHLQEFRDGLSTDRPDKLRAFIQKGAACRAADGVNRRLPMTKTGTVTASLGKYLKLSIYGASHAPEIGCIMENFPRNFPVDLEQLNLLMERRAPGRDPLSTTRKEPDKPEFLSGVMNSYTTGESIHARIRNTDVRAQDYSTERLVPRPGHADFPQWVQRGTIPTGGGDNSGRMTAPMCIAGGLCLQWLQSRHISVTSRLVAVAGATENLEAAIQQAKVEGDSVGGLLEVTVTGLPAGLGGAMFKGVESELSAALFAIPGVKGVSFGDGFRLASMHGSEANDPFVLQDGQVVTETNHHGGLLGGMTTGMPLVIQVAMKPTPSIFKEQHSVNLVSRQPETLQIRGRHDPCIARRALPVAEALTAFVLTDTILWKERETPRICLTLTEPTLVQDLQSLKENWPFVDMAELRGDWLQQDDWDRAAEFPALAGIPVILTIRRSRDGGRWEGTEEERMVLFEKLLTKAVVPFAFVDFEDDFRHPCLEQLARDRGTAVIRSLHDFNGPISDVVSRCQQLKGSSEEIPKLAFKVNHCSELTQLFRETADFTGFAHILCAMGSMGLPSRILAGRTHSMLSFVSPSTTVSKMTGIGHITPEHLVKTYGFRRLTQQTHLYAVTGFPLDHTRSPELNNAAFFTAAQDAVMVPIPAETPQEILDCARVLKIKGIAVTIPHKEAILPLLDSIDESVEKIGAANTVIQTPSGWKGFNTDAVGFKQALLEFLKLSSLEGKKVAILGAGGAARAVCYAVAKMGGQACVFNRSVEKAESLAALYGFKSAQLAPESNALLKEFGEIIIQTTSVGLKATSAEEDPILFYDFSGNEAVYDLVYAPEVTPILARAQAAGCKTQNGMSMLIEQAREQRRLYKLYG